MRRWIVTLGGAGLIPKAPGTWGSLLTCIILFPILAALGPSPTRWLIALSIALLLFSIACVAFGPFGIAHFQKEDPGPYVLDEAVGICLTLLFLPPQTGWRLVLLLAIAFAAFRIFDITKPPPARQLEHLPAGWGILLDDLAAAIYANLLCQIVVRFVL